MRNLGSFLVRFSRRELLGFLTELVQGCIAGYVHSPTKKKIPTHFLQPAWLVRSLMWGIWAHSRPVLAGLSCSGLQLGCFISESVKDALEFTDDYPSYLCMKNLGGAIL